MIRFTDVSGHHSIVLQIRVVATQSLYIMTAGRRPLVFVTLSAARLSAAWRALSEAPVNQRLVELLVRRELVVSRA